MSGNFSYQSLFQPPQQQSGGIPVGSQGTRITFNKQFQLVVSITITPQTTQKVFAIYSNLDNTGCNVFVYDTSGNRVTCTVTWLARGILK
jgi:hypothetical protein